MLRLSDPHVYGSAELINPHQLEENRVHLLWIKYLVVSVSQSSSEFGMSDSTLYSRNFFIITQ